MLLRSFAARMTATAAFLLGASAAAFAQSGTGVLTHHYNYARTGWNSTETILKPSTFTPPTSKFGVIATVKNLDDTILAQPLVVPNLHLSCPLNQTHVVCQKGLSGLFDVVFVATVANTIYAIDAANGQILLKRNFGPQVACGGINATRVIDSSTGTMYVITHAEELGAHPFKLHAVNVGTLTDALPPYSITDTNTFHTLSDGTIYRFDIVLSCQKSALLLVGGKIYAAFRGNEFLGGIPPQPKSGPTRGWLLGWNAADLSPLPPLLTDEEATAVNSFFLSSIWMSGAGIASDGGNLYFTTGNSDPSGKSYDRVKNIEESVVKVSPNMTVGGLFTPSDFADLDLRDFEIGSGGVMVLPHSPPLVVAAGKDGRMFLLDSANLGGYTPGGPDHVLDMHQIGGCWCALSYFMGPDEIGRVVSSGGDRVITWKLAQSGASMTPKLFQDGVGQIAPNIQDPGFFTTVSTNHTGTNYAGIIWAVGRPADSSNIVTLYAFDATSKNGTLALLGKYPAGKWIDERNANIVPVVANGKVFVASGAAGVTGTLTIFGIRP